MSPQPIPRYQQVKNYVLAQIRSGALQARDRVPSENELVSNLSVSRMTANRALREMTREGLLTRIAGVGTFVADLKAASHVLEVRNIADEIALRGHAHSARLVKQSRQRARGEIARALQVEQGESVFHIVIVHCENDIPTQLEDRYVLASFAPQCLQQDFQKITPSAYLSGIAALQEAEHVVRAVKPNASVRKHLDMLGDEPCLQVLRRTWANGQAVSFARLHHPGDRFELTGHYTPPGTTKTDIAARNVIELGRLRK